MAIYHLTASAGSRVSGASGGAKYDYIAREGRYERGADEVRHVESGHIPKWAADRPRSYWEAADAHERANGRLYREIHVALPAELNRREQLELARQLVRDITAEKRKPYTLAIHEGAPRRSGEPANPHAHLVWSDRGLDGHDRTPETWFRRANTKAPERGGARKHWSANGPRWLRQVREQWADRVNQALARGGHEARVDHRSWAARAVEAADAGDMEKAAALAREPNIHLGPVVIQNAERLATGRPASPKLEEAMAVEVRNAVLPELEAAERRGRKDINRIKMEVNRARWNLWEARHGIPVATYEPELQTWMLTKRDGKKIFNATPDTVREALRPSVRKSRPKTPRRDEPDRGFDWSR